MWDRIKAWFIQDEPTYSILPEKLYRKPSDTTPLTKGMVKFILEMKKLQEDHNEFYGKDGDHAYETTQDLCDYINMVFGTNFSRSKISKVWSSNFDSSKLLEGIEYQVPF